MRREGITKPIRLVDGVKEVFYPQSEGFCYLMKTFERWIHAVVYILANLLFRYLQNTGKFSVRYVFFINTSYSRSCDLKFVFFIALIV